MQAGRVEVHHAPGTLLFKRLTEQDLYWYDDPPRRKTRRRAVAGGQARPAYGCKGCGLITFDTTAEAEPRRRRRG